MLAVVVEYYTEGWKDILSSRLAVANLFLDVSRSVCASGTPLMPASAASFRPVLKGMRISPQRATDITSANASKSAAEVRMSTTLEISDKVLFSAAPRFSGRSSSYCIDASSPPVLVEASCVTESWNAVRTHSAAFCIPGWKAPKEQVPTSVAV
jgi:hypothetical protein